MALYRPPQLIAGEISGPREKFGGIGARLRLLSTHLEACTESNLETSDPLADAKCVLLAHMARCCEAPHEVSQIIMEPGRDRHLVVVGERRRSYEPRQAQEGRAR